MLSVNSSCDYQRRLKRSEFRSYGADLGSLVIVIRPCKPQPHRQPRYSQPLDRS